jgi:hypothetical protein
MIIFYHIYKEIVTEKVCVLVTYVTSYMRNKKEQR